MEKKEDIEHKHDDDDEPRIEEEVKGSRTEVVPENEESKKSSIRDNLMQLINQLDNRAGGSAQERR